MNLLVVELPDASELSIAVLACQDTSDGSFIGILLLPSPGHIETELRQFHVAISESQSARMPWLYHQPYRLLRIRTDVDTPSIRDKRPTMSWKNVYVAHRHFPRRPQINPGGTVVVHFPHWLIKELRDLGFTPNRHDAEKVGWDEEVAAAWSKLWTRGAKRGPVVFSNPFTKEGFRIEFDQCKDALWAHLAISTPDRSSDPLDFASEPRKEGGACEAVFPLTGALDPECSTHHVDQWPGKSKAFGDTARNVRMTFSRWPHPTRIAYLVDLRLGGTIYRPSWMQRSFSKTSKSALTRAVMVPPTPVGTRNLGHLSKCAVPIKINRTFHYYCRVLFSICAL